MELKYKIIKEIIEQLYTYHYDEHYFNPYDRRDWNDAYKEGWNKCIKKIQYNLEKNLS